MADWYVSSAAYAAIPAFVPSTAYTVGDIVKPTAPALKSQWAFRCSTAGTSGTEPTWNTANNGTVTTGGATFTNVTGQSAYGWGAAAGDLPTLNGSGASGAVRFQAGDRVFVSSDHAETQTTTTYFGYFGATASFSSGQVLSVNRAGSVPPTAADMLAGASMAVSAGTLNFDSAFPIYYYGITFPAAAGILFGNGSVKPHYFDACQLYLNTASAVTITDGAATNFTLNNSTLRFGGSGQIVTTGAYPMEITWQNTPSAIIGTSPTQLFSPAAGNGPQSVTVRGVDLSAITGTLVRNGSSCGSKYLFDSCRIASGVTRYNLTGVLNARDLVELINCYDGTSILNESYQPAGVVTTERTITLSGGATDDVGVFSHKLVSGTNVDKYVNPLLGFWMDVELQVVGAGRTATVEIISSGSLNTDDISLLLEYQGTAGSSVASFANTMPTTPLTAAVAITASTATWNASPATPVKQKLVVNFTPLVAGRVRGQVRLGKASTTVYVNPQITIS